MSDVNFDIYKEKSNTKNYCILAVFFSNFQMFEKFVKLQLLTCRILTIFSQFYFVNTKFTLVLQKSRFCTNKI